MTDQIERSVRLGVSVERLWRAVTDSDEFGAWFRVDLRGPFKLGAVTHGEMTLHGFEGLPFWLRVEAMDAPYYFRFSWPMDESVAPDDPDLAGKTTHVEFILERHGAGSKLTIRESGFERLPAEKGRQVFRDNQSGWTFQSGNIEAYLA